MKYSQLSELKIFAEGLVKNAGKIILAHQGKFKVVTQKDVRDVATSADIEAEKYIINALQETFPDHSIYSEEKGEIKRDSKYKWLVDPLDGTKAFVRNLPNFSCNICLTENDIPIVSAVYCPAFDRLYSAAKGMGAFINGVKTKLSSIDDIGESYVYCYLPTKNRKVINYEDSWNKIKKLADVAYRVHSESSVSLALCFLSNGGMEAYVDLSNPPHWHDLAPGVLIAAEAGAVINTTDFPLVASNNDKIYNELRKII